MKRFLFVAFHFPPQAESSGHLRALKACKHLPEEGWLPTVLTVRPLAYQRVNDAQLKEISPQVKVIRCLALDTARHLSIRGRYLRFMALPDRWATWLASALPAGWREIRRDDHGLILSTFPLATAVLIGWILHRITGKPWAVDIRDPLVKEDSPTEPSVRRTFLWIERKMVRDAAKLIFTTHAAMDAYLRRYPELSPERCVVISNGYDEEDFAALSLAPVAPPQNSRPLKLIHLGLLYRVERDPRPFLQAVARLKREGQVTSQNLTIDFRAPEFEDYYQEMVNSLELQDIVNILPPMPYREALQEAAQSDGLLLFQAASCDQQVPAKAYEYLRMGRPILSLIGRQGDTARLIRETGGGTIVELSDTDEIYRALPSFLEALRSGQHPLPDAQKVARYSRRTLAAELARCLEEVVEGHKSKQNPAGQPDGIVRDGQKVPRLVQ
jgi:glycosyltransferase involved in cell wall biosynthesis